jgi:ribose 5-phosphate isomerase B
LVGHWDRDGGQQGRWHSRRALHRSGDGARGARVESRHVICLSNRLLSADMAKEIMDAWFSTPLAQQGTDGVAVMKSVDEKWRRSPPFR